MESGYSPNPPVLSYNPALRLWFIAGVGYTLIPAGLPPGQFNLVQKGDDIITQAIATSEVPQRVWGSYSGIDMHPTLNKIYSAVGYAGNPSGQWAQSNAVTNIAQYA